MGDISSLFKKEDAFIKKNNQPITVLIIIIIIILIIIIIKSYLYRRICSANGFAVIN